MPTHWNIVKRILFIAVLLLLIVCDPAESKDGGSKNFPFDEGEELIYDVYFKRLRIGKSVLTFHGEENIDAKDVYHITFYTDLGTYEDIEDIYAYKETFLPLRISRTIKRIGAFPVYIEEEYDQDAFTVKIKKKRYFLSHESTIKKKGPIHNALLLTYLYRIRPVMERFSVILPMAEFDVIFKGKDIITTRLGRYPAYLFAGNPSNFTFWLSTDKKRFPLKMENHTVMGYTFVLNSIRNKAK